jgi:predicted double-glycine peptidase
MKRLLSLILVGVLLLSLNVVAFANETADDEFVKAGEIYVEPEEITRNSYIGGPAGAIPATEEQLAAAGQYEEEEILFQPINTTRATWTYLPNYYVYNQTTYYNCGPASIQAALRYINGSTPAQSEIARWCGTTSDGSHIESMTSYINTEGIQSRRNYVYVLDSSKSLMKTRLHTGIMGYDAPPIIGMVFWESDGWYYDTPGHFMSVYGVKSDQSEFALADPWIGYATTDPDLAGVAWSYSKDADTIYRAFSSYNIGYMY